MPENKIIQIFLFSLISIFFVGPSSIENYQIKIINNQIWFKFEHCEGIQIISTKLGPIKNIIKLNKKVWIIMFLMHF